jgi:site-specific DNA recombinase
MVAIVERVGQTPPTETEPASIIVDIYCRVSTDPQEDNTSLDEQEAAGRAYCLEHGYIVGMVHREVFSGYVYREREKLALVRERYLSGKIQGVVVRTFDRLSRKEVHFGILLEEMEHHGIELHCVKEVLEESLIGRMTRLFLGFLAEWEWEKIRERTTTGLINAAKQGKVVTGKKPPYGWRWQLNDKGEKVRIVHHETQLWVVRWMALKYARGTSTIEIARQLTARGIPTPEGEAGSQWQPIMIRRILTNGRLTGKAQIFAYHDAKSKTPLEPIDLPEGTYPAIISQALFDKLQERLQRNKEESSRKSANPEEFLLRAGYLRCGICGRKMHTRTDNDKKHRSLRPRKVRLGKDGTLVPVADSERGASLLRLLYRCKGEDNCGNMLCCGQELLAKEVDAWVWQELQKLADHIDLIRRAVELATNSNALEADVKAIDRSLALWEQKAKNYLEDLDDPDLRGDSRASIRQALNTANEYIEKLKGERTQVLLGLIDREREKAAYQDILTWCQTVKESRGELSYQHKRDFLHLLGVVVIAKKDETGNLDIRLEIELPEIQELIGQTGEFAERGSATSYGNELIDWAAGFSCWWA